MTADDDAAGAAPSEQHIKQQDSSTSEDMEADAEHELDELADAKPKKKRRVIRTLDKKYECPYKDCGKAYSRAEHLYRHQLNRVYLSTCALGALRGDLHS